MHRPHMGGLDRSIAFTALHDSNLPSETSDVTELLAAYDAWLRDQAGPFKAGTHDLWTYTREVYRQPAELEPYVRVRTAISRQDDRTTRTHAPYKVTFSKRFDAKSASANVEWLTQGELIELWQQIGILFGLGGMGTDLTDAQKQERVNPEL